MTVTDLIKITYKGWLVDAHFVASQTIDTSTLSELIIENELKITQRFR